MQNYRDPPPYPGHSKQVFPNQPGFRQSFSGSEASTDVSLSSTENLATCQRQEPQGEETQSPFYHHYNHNNHHQYYYNHHNPQPHHQHVDSTDGSSSYSILARLGMPPGGLEPSISGKGFGYPQHQQQQQLASCDLNGGGGEPNTGIVDTNPLYCHGNQLTVPQCSIRKNSGITAFYHQSAISSSSPGFITTRGLEPTPMPAFSTSLLSSSSSSSFSPSVSSSSLLLSSSSKSKSSQLANQTTTSLSLSSSNETVSSVGGHRMADYATNHPPPPTHPYLSPRVPPVSTYHHPHPYVNAHYTIPTTTSTSTTNTAIADTDSIRTCRSYEAIVDKMDKLLDTGLGQHPDIRHCASSPGIYVTHHSRSPVRSANASSDDGSDAATATKAWKMVDVLTEENRSLRDELAVATVKVSRLSKFELEVHKMHEAHQSLLQSHQKREALWLAMRRKLEERIRGLEESGSGGEPSKPTSLTEANLRSRLVEKESLITRLLAQNQDLMTSRQELETENIRLNVSLSEVRAHGDVENVLISRQGDEERTAISLTPTNDKPEDKQEVDGVFGQPIGVPGGWTSLQSPYHNQSSPVLCMEGASQPLKEVRLAALEKNASDVEVLIEEAKTEKLKHMEEMHESNKRMAELEAKVKQLHSQLLEKEAMVKVFQRLPRSSSLHALCHHSPRPSLIASSSSTSSTSTPSSSSTTSSSANSHKEFSSVRHMKTGSTSAIDMGRKMSVEEEDLLTKVQALNSCQTKDDSVQEVKLWHV